MTLSVVITTRNEAENIANCIHAFDAVRDRVEIIVVDNRSTDATKEIAAGLGALVLDKGPERCAQRNLGWRTAKADWVIVLDADMILPTETIEEILARAVPPSALGRGVVQDGLETPPARALGGTVQAYWIPEVRTGPGVRTKARNFERSFYDGTCIDGLRLFHKSVLVATGGYDESIYACEDWDLDRRVLATGAAAATLEGHLIHNEARQPLRRLLEKKAYYTKSVAAYRAKWNEDAICRRQFGFGYRYFGVFVEHGKWKRLLRHPVLAAVMYFERILVGFTYLCNR